MSTAQTLGMKTSNGRRSGMFQVLRVPRVVGHVERWKKHFLTRGNASVASL
jgi:hypothetical protein